MGLFTQLFYHSENFEECLKFFLGTSVFKLVSLREQLTIFREKVSGVHCRHAVKIVFCFGKKSLFHQEAAGNLFLSCFCLFGFLVVTVGYFYVHVFLVYAHPLEIILLGVK